MPEKGLLKDEIFYTAFFILISHFN